MTATGSLDSFRKGMTKSAASVSLAVSLELSMSELSSFSVSSVACGSDFGREVLVLLTLLVCYNHERKTHHKRLEYWLTLRRFAVRDGDDFGASASE